MNLNQLEYFISVANNLNFTKAAKEHFLSQTAISQQIKSLETTLGFQLFNRTKQSVCLTPAGECFYKEAKVILERANSAIKKATAVSIGCAGTLNIGFIECHEKILLPKLLSSFRNKYPDITLNLIRGSMDSLYKNLQDGLLDLVFSFDFDVNKYASLDTKSIGNYPLSAILYKDHPLSTRESLNRSELKDEDFIFIDRSVSPVGFDCMIADCVDSGYSPNFVYKADSIETVLLMIESKLGISILPRYDHGSLLGDLVFIDLSNEFTDSIISWNINNKPQQLQLFLDYVDSILPIKDYLNS